MKTAINQAKTTFRKKFKAITSGEYFEKILKFPEVTQWVIETIQQQLSERGVAGGIFESHNGRKLRTYRSKKPNVYAKKTIRIKKRLSGISRITTHVTLHNKGDFYRSMKMKVNRKSFIVNANFRKENGLISDWLDTSGTIALTKNNLNILVKQIIETNLLILLHR